MYSEEDINSAVAARAISAEAASGFRNYMSKARELPRGSEENFRLINSFNDIFVSIGVVILLIAVGAIGQAISGIIAPSLFETYTLKAREEWNAARKLFEALSMAFAGLLVAATAWPLTEIFTRKRRMALPSIILLLAFIGGVFFAFLGTGMAVATNGNDTIGALMISVAALVSAGAAFIHYRRFMVPITVAAGAAGIAGTVIALIIAAISPDNLNQDVVFSLVFIAGLCVWAFAMRWDISDRERITRRSDVAFWLHLMAAPMIAHPVFALLGVTDGGNLGIGAAVGVLAVYVAFGLVALAIDRRALLVSALIYVLLALAVLFREFGAVKLNFALTALVIGSALLSLSAFWQPIRRVVVGALPLSARSRLPAADDAPVTYIEPSVA